MENLIVRFKDSTNMYILTDFSQEGHVVTLNGANIPTDETSGFYISREGHPDNWDYTEFTTLYRIVDEDTVQFSDDGSVYEPPMMDVIVYTVWEDENNVLGVRPNGCHIKVTINGVSTKIWLNNIKQGYSYNFGSYPVDSEVIVTPYEAISGDYKVSVEGMTITYTMAIPQPRQIAEQDIVDAILMLADGNEPDVTSLWASQCENNIKNFNDVPDHLQEAVNKMIDADGFMVKEDGTVDLKPFSK